MKTYEYKIVAAPMAIQKSWFARHDDGFADNVSDLMNEFGACGWDYVRSETLTFRKRRWYGARRHTRHEVLVFRRMLANDVTAEDRARIVLTEVSEFGAVTPRRVRNAEAVARVKAGNRRIEMVGEKMSHAANGTPMTAAE